MIDYIVWTSMERLLAKGYDINPKVSPKLAVWVERMGSLSAVRDVRNSDLGYRAYWASQLNGATEYDIVE